MRGAQRPEKAGIPLHAQARQLLNMVEIEIVLRRQCLDRRIESRDRL
jgi:hypothetical protein